MRKDVGDSALGKEVELSEKKISLACVYLLQAATFPLFI